MAMSNMAILKSIKMTKNVVQKGTAFQKAL